jgi:hypothetical protein
MMLPFLLMAGNKPLVKLSHVIASNIYNSSYSNVTLTEANSPRTVIAISLFRTNSTTGERRITSLSLLANQTTYPFAQLVGPTSNESHPLSVWSVNIPSGAAVGTLSTTHSGTGTPSASDTFILYTVVGGQIAASARNLSSNISIAANSGDIIIRSWGRQDATSPGTELNHSLIERASAAPTQLECQNYAGVLDPVLSTGTVAFSTSNATRSSVVVIRGA